MFASEVAALGEVQLDKKLKGSVYRHKISPIDIILTASLKVRNTLKLSFRLARNRLFLWRLGKEGFPTSGNDTFEVIIFDRKCFHNIDFIKQ